MGKGILFAATAALLAAAAPAAPRFEYDCSGAPELKEWTLKTLKPAVEKWYPLLAKRFASPEYREPKTIRLRYLENDKMNGTPAWTAGDEISMNRQWYAGQLDNEAAGCTIHELTHVIQQYKGGVPGWFQEGFADYTRWFLFEPEKQGARVNFDDPGAKHDAGYRVSANFIDWVARRYGEKAVAEINAAARAKRYSDGLWKQATGSDLAALEAQWKAARGEVLSLEPKIAAKHRILESDEWGGGHRIVFDFNGRRAWVVEPATPRADRPWIWTMQWMGAFLDRSGIPELMARGYCHVHLEAFDTKADDAGLKALAAFQEYLVKELGFAPKARLLGMSWGGFYAVRYANAYPENVARVLLDAPLLSFAGFAEGRKDEIGSWAAGPRGGGWASDPRMPVNMASALARKGIPFYLLYGGSDTVVPPKTNAEIFAARFKGAGGRIVVDCRALYGHHPHGFERGDVGKALDFYDGE